jgi:effector-binding domain-containing protein
LGSEEAGRREEVRISKFAGKENFIRAKLEEGHSFRGLSRELGVSHQALINHVKGLDRHYRKKYIGITFSKPLTTKDFAERNGVSISAVRVWLRQGRIKGRKVGQRWIIIE